MRVSMAAAAQRELAEETGYTSRRMIALGAYYANWAHQANKMHYFLALDCVLEKAQALDPNEDIDVVLLDIETAYAPGTFEQSYLLGCLLLARPHLEP